jgi:hypothetical protein
VSGSEGGGIFISYRRQESKHVAGRMYDRLAGHFGVAQVFMDVDTIEPGADFVQAISRAVADCRVLLAIIGPDWLTIADARGRRRLDDPDDIVRVEAQTALARDVRVIPILVEDAVMPTRDDLPGTLAGLVRRNAFTVRHESFRSDTERLIAVIDGIVPGSSQVRKESLTSPGRWQLVLIDDAGATKTFLLWSEMEEHELIVGFGWSRDVLKLDGQPITEDSRVYGRTFTVTSLSKRLRRPVIVDVRNGTFATYRLKSLIVTIGDQVLRYDSGIK